MAKENAREATSAVTQNRTVGAEGLRDVMCRRCFLTAQMVLRCINFGVWEKE